MKKRICLCLSLVLILSICAGCGSKTAQKETEPQANAPLYLEKEKITAENVSPYDGLYLEYGDMETVSGLYAVKFTNTGDQTIQDTYQDILEAIGAQACS